MTTSKNIVTTFVVAVGMIGAVVGVAPFAVAEDAGNPEPATGASTTVQGHAQDEASTKPSQIVEEATHTDMPRNNDNREVIAPKAVNSTSVGNGKDKVSTNKIDTSDKEAVRRAYMDRYLANHVQIQPSDGANVDTCEEGHVNPQAADAVINAWNFFRGLNNLDAVSSDPASPLTRYVQKAALSQAAENVKGTRSGLTHHPMKDKFVCGTKSAERGASTSNLAHAKGFTASEQINWWYQDWSGYKASTMTSDGFNDKLGHRNWLMDPYIRETAYGNVRGYNALAVATGSRFDDYDSSRMKNLNATTPETMAWPSQGYFPAELLTSTTANETNGADVERWSFRVLGADMTHAQVSVTGPQGSIPVRVVANGKYRPTSISGYGTVLFKMSNKYVHAPKGTGVNTYSVRVTGVKGTSTSSYYYQVKLFNADATPSRPTINIIREPLVIEGSTSFPARVHASGANNIYQWQLSSDKGKTWEDAPVWDKQDIADYFGKANEVEWAPGLKVCKDHHRFGPCPLTQNQVENYRFRLRATNSYGTTYSKPLQARSIHFVDTPSAVKRGQVIHPRLNIEGNDDFVTVKTQPYYFTTDIFNKKKFTTTNINEKKIVLSITVWAYGHHYSIGTQAQKTIAIR